MSRKLMPCDLCEQPSERRRDSDETGTRDAFFVECKSCGTYSITGVAAKALSGMDAKMKGQIKNRLKSWVEKTGGAECITTDAMSSMSEDDEI